MGASKQMEEARLDSSSLSTLLAGNIPVQPDIVEYDENHMTEPGFDLILGCNTMKELGIVLDFWTKEISIDEISLPMRGINN